MILRALWLVTILKVLALTTSANILAQDINSLKQGVVRIRNDRFEETGTGFIVKVDGDQVYIVTAAHVVRGDQHPAIYLFTRQHESLQAEILDREEDDIKGLALLRLTVSADVASKLTALKLTSTKQLDGGQDIKVIGFPDDTSFWTVGSGTIARLEGRNLVFSQAVRGGNSGGPVISNGLVVGMVTDVSQASAYAVPGEVLGTYVDGLVPDLRTDEIVGKCSPYPVFYSGTKGRLTSWTGNDGLITGTSDVPTVVENYYVCEYTLPQPASSLTVKFLGGSIEFSAPGGSGGGLGLLVYNGRPDYVALQAWNNHGNPKYEHWWSKEERRPTTRIEAEPLEHKVDLGKRTNLVSVVLMLADAWDSQSVKVQIKGISIKPE
jgi:hypothetical protein